VKIDSTTDVGGAKPPIAKRYTDGVKIETRAIHAGRRIDPGTGAVTPPIQLSTTYERTAEGDYPLGFSYSREGNPNRRALEECLADLEGGKEALAFSSGLAVASAVLQGLEPGDHVLVADDVYWAFRRVIGDVFAKSALETSYVDMTDLDAVRAALRPNTRLVWLETPSNPLLKIADLAAVAEIVRAAGPQGITVCDGTFATPVLQRPLDLGIDMVAHSTTKYIGGHSDVVGGALITRHDNYLFERARKAQKYGGSVPSPFDCWLTLRGIDTLPYRVRAHAENALRIAQCLSRHGRVEAVHYPGLPGHPGHAIAARQMAAFGGMLSFQVRGGREDAMGVAARCQLFIRATSLGGAHSLIEHRASIEGPQTRTPQNLLRCSIGLEHPDDLWADLEQALG
jgi:cystathionine gamma-synthase